MNAEQSLFVLANAEKCTGCRACELACFAGHREKKTNTVGSVSAPVIPRLYLSRGAAACMPVQCHHCEDAPCMRSCLTGALERIEGVVVLNPRKCIGCRNCAIACPFGAIEVFSQNDLKSACVGSCGSGEAHKLVYKCDLCIDADKPACVAACPNEALRLVDTEAELNEKRINALSATEAFNQPKTAGAAVTG